MSKLDKILDGLDRRMDFLEDLAGPIHQDFLLKNREHSRCVPYWLCQQQTFVAADAGSEGAAMRFEVSMDGAFVMTDYPHFTWFASTPTNATYNRAWRSITAWPYPDQSPTYSANSETEYINVSYRLADAGSGREFQSSVHGASDADQPGRLPAPGDILDPDNGVPVLLSTLPACDGRLPTPVYFQPRSTIIVTPYYEDVVFDSTSATPTTGGTLHVTLIGYKIILP